MAIKFHKTFGQIEVINENDSIIEIVIVSTGETKKLSTQFAKHLIQDEPFVKVKKAVAKQRQLTKEEIEHAAKCSADIMKEEELYIKMTPEQRLENARYRQAGSSLRK